MRYLVFAMVATVAAAYADKPAGPVSSEDEYLVVTASALVDRAEVTKALGYDAGMDLVIVDVKLAPRGENKITVSHDDFTLISRKDGQRSQPLAPSQIAGKGALVVAQGGRGGGGGLFTGSRGPIWGGAPGTGTRPERVGSDGETVVTGTGSTETQAVINEGSQDKENPFLAVLKEKSLQQRETSEPVTGLLYFYFEGKHKLKDLELMYKSPAGRMMLDFQK